jgi:hypothetical protein
LIVVVRVIRADSENKPPHSTARSSSISFHIRSIFAAHGLIVLGKKGEELFRGDLRMMASLYIAEVSDGGAELFHFLILAFQRIEDFPDPIPLIGDGGAGAG